VYSGHISEEEADNIQHCVASYTDTPLKQAVSQLSHKLDDLQAFTNGTMQPHTLNNAQDLRDMKIRFAQFEDTMLMRLENLQTKVNQSSSNSQALVNGS
jgi:hypothetical protein